MLHSDSLQPYCGVLSAHLQSAIDEIAQYFGITPKVLSYDDRTIVVPVSYNVSLPSRGTVNNIDIKEVEPMMISFSLEYYPAIAPSIASDRPDFPRSQLSHLYFTKENEPAKLCLIRNSPNEWFAQIRFSDFLAVGQQWLYKAATGQLNEDGDEFDPVRIEENVGARHIFKYDTLTDVISNNQRFCPDVPMALFAGAQILNGEEVTSYQTTVYVPFIAYEAVLNTLKRIPKGASKAYNQLFTLVFWEANQNVEDLYTTSLPKNYRQLKDFFGDRGIDLGSALKNIEKIGAIVMRGLPIIYAVKRPKKLIGQNGSYEFFNFLLIVPKEGISKLSDSDPVFRQSHVEPFGSEMGMFLSGESKNDSALYLGAGSLGSKVLLHDVRAGNLDVAICDPDQMLPHNLARHELFSEHVGKNKSQAIVDEIQKFFPCDNVSKINSYPFDAILLPQGLLKYRKIVDTTASVQVQNFMVTTTIPQSSTYFKGEIADEGALGLFYAEGEGRNPRMDDLVNLAYYLSLKNPQLQAWRINDASRQVKTLNVGQGCSSTTSIMANDTIDFHGSYFSRLLKKANQENLKGFIAISVLDERSGMPTISSEIIQVLAFTTLECKNGSGWQVRLIHGLAEKLLKKCNVKAPQETGGVLIGIGNYKTKVIHVFDVIFEPLGSHGTPTRFTRGTNGLPKEIDTIKESTGNVIGYIGEWHTHPMNLKELSETDKEAIELLKPINQIVPIPTCSLIVTPRELLAFVEE